jgi:hypothetical protein
MATAYTTVVTHLLSVLDCYRKREIEINELKSAIWKASQTISSYEERELRHSLQSAEGELDMVQFSTGSAHIDASAMEIANALEAILRRALDN